MAILPQCQKTDSIYSVLNRDLREWAARKADQQPDRVEQWLKYVKLLCSALSAEPNFYRHQTIRSIDLCVDSLT
eukprot:SAG25_NODE_10679_length_325_cov_1.553097_1_plen_73_part_10